MNRTKTANWARDIFIVGIGLLLASSAQAAGFGGYFEYGYADGEFDDSPIEADYDTHKFGFGFILDTNVARNSLFNYRLTAGYQHSEREIEDTLDWDSDGFSLNNTFGFGIYRDPRLRVWAGPALRLNIDVVDDGISGLDVVDVAVGGGPQVGINLHTGDRVSLSLSTAYQYLYVGEIFDSDFDTETVDGAEHLVTVGVSVLFRTGGDRYDSQP